MVSFSFLFKLEKEKKKNVSTMSSVNTFLNVRMSTTLASTFECHRKQWWFVQKNTFFTSCKVLTSKFYPRQLFIILGIKSTNLQKTFFINWIKHVVHVFVVCLLTHLSVHMYACACASVCKLAFHVPSICNHCNNTLLGIALLYICFASKLSTKHVTWKTFVPR